MKGNDVASEENEDTITVSTSQNGSSSAEDNDATITVSSKKKKNHSSSTPEKKETVITVDAVKKPRISSQIVTAESVQAEEVPTIPLSSLQTLSALEPEVAVRSVASTQNVRLPAPLVVQPSEYKRTLGEWIQVWWDGMRPGYFALSLPPVLLGSVIAWAETISHKTPFGHFDLPHFIAIVLAVAIIQIGANLLNDYYDYIKGVDTSNPLGPGGLIQQGLIRPTRVLNFGLICLILGAIIGMYAALAGGLLLLPLGLVGLLCAYFYSGPSRSLASLSLGELTAFLVFGPLLTLGSYLVMSHGTQASLSHVLLYSLPLGLLATAAIHVNNMRDVESDGQAKKRTLATLLNLRFNRAVYIVLVLAAYGLIVGLAVPHNAPHWLLLTLWTLPTLTVALTGIIRADLPPALNLVVRQTLKLVGLFALLFVIGIILNAFLPVLPQLPAKLLPF